MATYTTRLNLKKPDPSDFYNIEDFNENSDKIDTFAKTTSDHIANKQNPHNVTLDQVLTAGGSVVPVTAGGTGLSSAPSMLTNLASTTAASPLQASPRPGVTGTLPVANGGTGKGSWAANRIAYPSAATAMSQIAFPGTAGSVLAQGTSGAPYWRNDIITLLDLLKSLGSDDGERLSVTWNLTSGRTNGAAWSPGGYFMMERVGDFAEYTATISGASAIKFLIYMPSNSFAGGGSSAAPTDKATLYVGSTAYELGDNIGHGYDQRCPEIYFVKRVGKVASSSTIKLRFTCQTAPTNGDTISYMKSISNTMQAYAKGGMS